MCGVVITRIRLADQFAGLQPTKEIGAAGTKLSLFPAPRERRVQGNCAPQLPVWFLSLHEYIPRKMPTAFSNPPLPAMREKSHFSTKYHTGWSPCTTQQTRAKTGFPFFFFFFFFWAASRWLNQRQIPKHFWGRILQIWVSFASMSK